MKHRCFALTVVALTWACDDGGRSSSPTSPASSTDPVASGPVISGVTYSLSGVVSEATPAGWTPVEGAEVRLSNVRRAETTDRNGFYRIAGVATGVTSVSVTAAGYQTVNREVRIDGDIRLDIPVVRGATHTLSGLVSEVTAAGAVPIEGVWVSESHFHAGVWTDRDGHYRFSGPYGTGVPNTLSFSKEGYKTERRDVVMDGDTQLDIQLNRR